MDIVLEVFDTFIADPLYAAVLPAELSKDSGVNGTTSEAFDGGGYVYEPSTKYFHLEPSECAYMSSWPRDNVYRQGLSLYLITWYVDRSLPNLTFFLLSKLICSALE